MTIIIGLGNPGEQFKNTRHNVGFMVLDKFAGENNFPNFELNKKANALISKNENVLLAKPQTFMNESGKTVSKLISNFKCKPYGDFLRVKQISNLVVVHDDIDLPVGKIKIIKERGSAGHKGVESIIKSIGNDGLIRIRIGIAPEKEIEAKKIVLKKFTKKEQEILESAVKKTSEALSVLLKEGLEKAMNEYNK